MRTSSSTPAECGAAPEGSRRMSSPRISVAMPAYQAEPWIGEALESVLDQSAPPDEVVVVDDGSTDATPDVARSFGEPVRVVRQQNTGPSGAYNRAFLESTSEYVAMCPADDLWEPRKLELQRAVLAEHPEVDVAFAGARFFGLEEREFEGPAGEGVLNPRSFFSDMYRTDLVPTPSAVIRRDLWDRLGRFREDLACEDYEFWLRALRERAVFYFDPRMLVRLRQHGGNFSSQALRMWEMNHRIHSEYAADLEDAQLADEVLARDLRTIGRCRLGLSRAKSARRAYSASLGHSRHPSAAAWVALLSLPGAGRALDALAGRRQAGA